MGVGLIVWWQNNVVVRQREDLGKECQYLHKCENTATKKATPKGVAFTIAMRFDYSTVPALAQNVLGA